MWKLLVGFIIFAALAVFLLMKDGANVDMGGEKHGVEAAEPAHETRTMRHRPPHLPAQPRNKRETAPRACTQSARPS